MPIIFKYAEQILLAVLSTLSLFGIFHFNGIGLEADSFHHHLIARFAIEHPHLFLDHWGKPLYTILSSPFAYFGFKGTQIFNWSCTSIIFLFLFKISKQFGLKHAFLAPILFFLFPITITTSYFGFTEPLAALFLIFAIHSLINKRYLLAALIISFIPFIRSEGLILIGAFGIFFIYKRHWKALLFLAIGHIFFSLVGYLFLDENLLWVFNKIPYASLSSHYGSGALFHFVDKLIYLLGVPSLILFLLGIVLIPFSSSNKKEELLFVASTFLIFFIAHSLFWYLGIFNSMGLERVFAAVSPLMALIALFGFNKILELIRNTYVERAIGIVLLAYIIIFPFTSNPAAVDWNKELNLSPPQKLAEETGSFIVENNLGKRRFIYTDNYLARPLNIDPYKKDNRLILAKPALNKLNDGDIIIWDNWHSVVDYGITLEMLTNNRALFKVREFVDNQHKREVKYVIFEAKLKH